MRIFSRLSRSGSLLVALIFGCPNAAIAEPTTVRLIGWNLHSGNSDAKLLASQAARADNIDLWGLSEVENQSVVCHGIAHAGANGRLA